MDLVRPGKDTPWPGVDGALAFPDSVTMRGRKHLRELARRVAAGDRAVLLFLANRPFGDRVRPRGNHDLPSPAAAGQRRRPTSHRSQRR